MKTLDAFKKSLVHTLYDSHYCVECKGCNKKLVLDVNDLEYKLIKKPVEIKSLADNDLALKSNVNHLSEPENDFWMISFKCCNCGQLNEYEVYDVLNTLFTPHNLIDMFREQVYSKPEEAAV